MRQAPYPTIGQDIREFFPYNWSEKYFAGDAEFFFYVDESLAAGVVAALITSARSENSRNARVSYAHGIISLSCGQLVAASGFRCPYDWTPQLWAMLHAFARGHGNEGVKIVLPIDDGLTCVVGEDYTIRRYTAAEPG